MNSLYRLSSPSVELSQKHELAVCRPAPFFCIITQVTAIPKRDVKKAPS